MAKQLSESPETKSVIKVAEDSDAKLEALFKVLTSDNWTAKKDYWITRIVL